MFSISLRMDVKLQPGDLLRQYGLEQGGRVQKRIDRMVIGQCGPYVPANSDRALVASARQSAQSGGGQIIWDTPYARFQYYGKVMTDELGRTWVGAGEKKPIVTRWPLAHDAAQNPLAGPYWFERAKADHMNEWLEEARKAMLKGG